MMNMKTGELSRKERILKMLSNPKTKLTCQQITNRFIKQDDLTGNVAKYLSGSISSILAKLVKTGELKYADKKTDRGGHIYQKGVEPEQQTRVKLEFLVPASKFEMFAHHLGEIKQLLKNET